jgi:mannose-6-phosphate isomerase-like protein (cupin superfamily)
MATSNGANQAQASSISLSKGGGAIRGIGETFQPNLFTGTGNFSVPIYTAPGRNGFGPKLTLQYSTGNGRLDMLRSQPGHPMRHKTVEKIWYFLEGEGEFRRNQDGHEEVVKVGPRISLTIPVGTHFQFRNTGSEPLRFIIVTMPPWFGEDEALRVEDYW